MVPVVPYVMPAWLVPSHLVQERQDVKDAHRARLQHRMHQRHASCAVPDNFNPIGMRHLANRAMQGALAWHLVATIVLNVALARIRIVLNPPSVNPVHVAQPAMILVETLVALIVMPVTTHRHWAVPLVFNVLHQPTPRYRAQLNVHHVISKSMRIVRHARRMYAQPIRNTQKQQENASSAH